jgi:hypothetical protein
LESLPTASTTYDLSLFIPSEIIDIVSYRREKTSLSMSSRRKVAIGMFLGVAALTAILVPSLYFGLAGKQFYYIDKQIFIFKGFVFENLYLHSLLDTW